MLPHDCVMLVPSPGIPLSIPDLLKSAEEQVADMAICANSEQRCFPTAHVYISCRPTSDLHLMTTGWP